MKYNVLLKKIFVKSMVDKVPGTIVILFFKILFSSLQIIPNRKRENPIKS